MPDTLLDRDPQVRADISAEKMHTERLKAEIQARTLAGNATARGNAESVSNAVNEQTARLNALSAQLAERKAQTDAASGSTTEFNQKVADAELTAQMNPEPAAVSEGEKEHERLKAFVENSSTDARPADVTPPMSVENTTQQIIRSEVAAKERRKGILDRIKPWTRGNGFQHLKSTQTPSRPTIATTPGLTPAEFTVAPDSSGQMNVQRPGESLILKPPVAAKPDLQPAGFSVGRTESGGMAVQRAQESGREKAQNFLKRIFSRR